MRLLLMLMRHGDMMNLWATSGNRTRMGKRRTGASARPRWLSWTVNTMQQIQTVLGLCASFGPENQKMRVSSYLGCVFSLGGGGGGVTPLAVWQGLGEPPPPDCGM